MAGTGPEYSLPVTGKDEPLPVVGNEDPVVEDGGAFVGEDDTGDLNEKFLADQEELETQEADEWSEDMAFNEIIPGEEEDTVLPDAKDSHTA